MNGIFTKWDISTYFFSKTIRLISEKSSICSLRYLEIFSISSWVKEFHLAKENYLPLCYIYFLLPIKLLINESTSLILLSFLLHSSPFTLSSSLMWLMKSSFCLKTSVTFLVTNPFFCSSNSKPLTYKNTIKIYL